MIDAWMTCTKQTYIDRVWRGHTIWYERTVKFPLYWAGLPGFYETNKAVSLLGNGWWIYTFLYHMRKQIRQGACVQTRFFPSTDLEPMSYFQSMKQYSHHYRYVHVIYRNLIDPCTLETSIYFLLFQHEWNKINAVFPLIQIQDPGNAMGNVHFHVIIFTTCWHI